MRRLFIDCDDTLVIYENDNPINPYGSLLGEPYRLNTDLIEVVKSWEGQVFVWSGGGLEYAQAWAREAFGDEFDDWGVPLIKDESTFGLVRVGDVCVDDQPLDLPGSVMTSEAFLESVPDIMKGGGSRRD